MICLSVFFSHFVFKLSFSHSNLDCVFWKGTEVDRFWAVILLESIPRAFRLRAEQWRPWGQPPGGGGGGGGGGYLPVFRHAAEAQGFGDLSPVAATGRGAKTKMLSELRSLKQRQVRAGVYCSQRTLLYGAFLQQRRPSAKCTLGSLPVLPFQWVWQRFQNTFSE